MSTQCYPDRQSIRLRSYDYTWPGAYFVTMCTSEQQHLLGSVEQDTVVLSDWGRVVAAQWQAVPAHCAHVRLDEWVIMPNHMHAVLWIMGTGEAFPTADLFEPALSHRQAIRPVNTSPGNASPLRPAGAVPGSVGAIIGNLKSVTARRINQLRNMPGEPVWQRNYYEHVIRTEEALSKIRQYIVDNPKRWHLDRYHPDPAGPDPWAAEIWRLMHL
jgi:REP element-mobilizing transposase RayT